MTCDCQSRLFDCEDRVRRFLRATGETGNDGRGALDELIEKVTPLVERTVSLKLQGNPWRDYRADAIQNTFVKLCDPERLGTWLESPRRSWFCHWAYVVAYHCALDVFRKPPSPRQLGDVAAKPAASVEMREQAARLRETINATLSEFDLEWRLVFYMRYSYLDIAISAIARAANLSKEAVFFRLRKMKKCIAGRCAALLSPEVSKIALAGTRHPVEGFERLEKVERDQLNGTINELLGAHPLKEQFAFYMKYSPLAPDVDSIALQIGENRDRVCGWLERIETQIKPPHRSDPG